MCKNSIEILKVARERIDNYVDMGHFRDPKEATPYLVDGFQLGYKHAEKEINQERDSLLEKLKMAEEKFSVLETEEWYWEYHPYIKDGKEQPGLIKNISKIREFARECLQKLRGEGK